MATYVVRIWDEASITKEREVIRKRRDSAMLYVQRAVYDVLKAFGKLDTPAAHTARAQAYAMDDLIEVGAQRSMLVSNTGKRVTLSRED